MGLFRPDTEDFTAENALLTAITAKDGSFAFEKIPFGHWIVKEISAPALYTVSPEQHPFISVRTGSTSRSPWTIP